MSVHRGLGEQHEVLSEEPFCSGYIDTFGKWNNGFDCPPLDGELVHCCGTLSYRYCCTGSSASSSSAAAAAGAGGAAAGDSSATDFISERWPLLLGVVGGTLLTTAVIAVIVVSLCRSRLCCSKRNPAHKPPSAGCGGSESYYAAPSTISGVTSLYGGTSSSMSRSGAARVDSAQQHLQERLQEVDEIAVHYPQPPNSSCSVNNLNVCSTFPRSFSNFSAVKVSADDSMENTSMSTSSDNDRQCFMDLQCALPPPMSHLQAHSRLLPRSLHHTPARPASTLRLPDIESVVKRAESGLTGVVGSDSPSGSLLPAPALFRSRDKLGAEYSLQQNTDRYCLATKM